MHACEFETLETQGDRRNRAIWWTPFLFLLGFLNLTLLPHHHHLLPLALTYQPHLTFSPTPLSHTLNPKLSLIV